MNAVRLGALLALLLPGLAGAVTELAGGELTGQLGFEGRLFAEQPAYAGQDEHAAALRLKLEYYRAWEADSVVVAPYLRLGSGDEDAGQLDLREAYWLHVAEAWELRAGFNRVFWGVTESRHLVDVINQSDLVDDLDGEAKLGQPMLQLSLPTDWGTVHGFLLPYFRERTFPGEAGRLRTGLLVDTDAARYESDDEQRHLDWALRYTQHFGPLDLGLSYFEGTNRDPALLPELRADGPVLVPYYGLIRQAGLDAQLTLDAWLWKLELLRRRGELNLLGQDEDYLAAVGGLEYTFFGVGESEADLGVLVEYLWDERGERATTPFQDDLFVGFRLGLNDIQDTAVLAGVIVDQDHGAQAWRLEASRRLGETWTGSLEAVVFANPQPEDPLYALRRDDHLMLELVYWF